MKLLYAEIFELSSKQITDLDWPLYINTFIVFLIGFFNGVVELYSRYANLKRIWHLQAGRIYLLLNGFLASCVYILIETGNVQIKYGNYTSGPFLKVVIAGTTAMLLLRSTISSLKINNNEVQVGLAPILQVLLNAVNRDYDRNNSQLVLEEVAGIMSKVNFDAAKKDLPYLCLTMMKTLSREEIKHIGEQVASIENEKDIDIQTKAISLGLHLGHYTGIELLKSSVNQLENILKKEATQKENILNDLINEYKDNS